MNHLNLILMGVLASTQLFVPFGMIRSQERILREGAVYRFLTQPIDPADPFQGRYVRLRIRSSHIACDPQSADLKHREPIYATLAVDGNGFAYFDDWSREPAAEGDYLETRYRGVIRQRENDSPAWATNGIRIDIPFDRFYMDEAKAPRAEALARDATRNTNCWVSVRVLNGKALIEDVYAGGESLRVLAAKKDG
jgi:uncharacterized membrane-anchored protein